MTPVDVVIPCGTNCEGYVEFLLWSIRQTAIAPDRFRYLFGISNDNVNEDRLRNIGNSLASYKIIDARGNHGYYANSHGTTLDKTFVHVESDIAMILDCDTAFLHYGWDNQLIGMLSTTNVIVGSAYEENYESVGADQKYVKWPNVIACIVNTQVIRKHDISFQPAAPIVLDETNAHLYGLSIGQRILRDTGHELSLKLRLANYTSTYFPLIRAKDAESLFLKGCRGDEYQFEGVPMVTHVGRSLSRTFGHDPIAIAWENRVRKWIENEMRTTK